MKFISALFLISISFLNYSNRKLFVFVGPSGVGKSTLVSALSKAGIPLEFIISHTTRPMRVGEQHAKDYFFLSKEEFAQKAHNDEFIAITTMYGNSYGISKELIRTKLQAQNNLIMCLNAEVAQKIQQFFSLQVSIIFIAPPSLHALKNRLESRNTESPSALQIRLAAVAAEMELQDNFEHKIINDDLGQAVIDLKEIILKHTHKQ